MYTCLNGVNVPGRLSCHPSGYNCVYYDGHVEFYGGTNATWIDTLVIPVTTGYSQTGNVVKRVFDHDSTPGYVYTTTP